ncbi:MAG: hypothetical protein OXU61_09310 [Gammaproteobacteria bacterium]|nr:hypothetical protein [Gammaproteobacteria bacterium]
MSAVRFRPWPPFHRNDLAGIRGAPRAGHGRKKPGHKNARGMAGEPGHKPL